MNVYKVELMILNFDDLNEQDVTAVIENQKFPNRCIDPIVMRIESRDIGDWHDEHVLNDLSEQESAFNKLFSI